MKKIILYMFHPYGFYFFARFLRQCHIPIVPKLIDHISRLIFACWLPHAAKIGKGLVLGYGGLGIVIHSNAQIGDNVHIDQFVTLGGNARQSGVPKIGDNVYIGCGAKILGPITIGNDCVIGANSVVIKDVPANCVVAGVPARVIHENININEYLYHLKNKSSHKT